MAKRSPIVHIKPEAFVKEYIKDHNGTKAVQAIDKAKSPAVAAVKSTRLLKTDKVQRLLTEIEAKIKDNAALAVRRQTQLIASDNEAVAASMVKDSLDRAGFKPSDKLETISSINISFGLGKAQIIDEVVE